MCVTQIGALRGARRAEFVTRNDMPAFVVSKLMDFDHHIGSTGSLALEEFIKPEAYKLALCRWAPDVMDTKPRCAGLMSGLVQK